MLITNQELTLKLKGSHQGRGLIFWTQNDFEPGQWAKNARLLMVSLSLPFFGCVSFLNPRLNGRWLTPRTSSQQLWKHCRKLEDSHWAHWAEATRSLLSQYFRWAAASQRSPPKYTCLLGLELKYKKINKYINKKKLWVHLTLGYWKRESSAVFSARINTHALFVLSQSSRPNVGVIKEAFCLCACFCVSTRH